MSYPFMDDPIPPGHGESQHSLDATMDAIAQTPEYSVIVIVGGKPEIEATFGDLGEALAQRDKVRTELKAQGFDVFFAGVMDMDAEPRWLESEDDLD